MVVVRDDVVGVLDDDVLWLYLEPVGITLNPEAFARRHCVLILGPADVGDDDFRIRNDCRERVGSLFEACAVGDAGLFLLSLGVIARYASQSGSSHASLNASTVATTAR